MYNYNAYNIGISSELPLPELQTSVEVATDVTIRFGRVTWSPPLGSMTADEPCFKIATDEAHFFWPLLGKFRVRDGTEIIIDPCAGVEERLLRLPLLGTLLAVLLHQRGSLVLHASAVAIDGEAIIFVGNKGYGKSTMAATLYGRGHQLLSDDVVALAMEGPGRPMVIPGFPQFKLYPEVVSLALGDDPSSLRELADGYEKCGRRVSDRFAQQALPLKSIYELGRGPVPTVRQLDSQGGLLTLIANSYMARFGRQLLNGAEASVHLRKCTKLMMQANIYRLERPSSLSLLPSIAQLVEEHLYQGQVLV